MSRHRHPFNRIASAMLRLFGGDAGAGLLLILAATAALVAANSPWAELYHHLLHGPLPSTPVAKLRTAHLWINDAVMAVFFFVVGLEIKRELLVGALSTPAQRRLPILAALGGMAVPALIYLMIVGTTPGLARGWAIPAATDIAFAVGVLALAGPRVPPALRLFLLTVAIVDDLGAVAIIAVFYTAQLKLGWMAAAALGLGAMAMLGRANVHRGWPYLPLIFLVWFCVLNSGVHATVAGVLAAFTIPLRLHGADDSLLLRMEHALVPWSAYLVVPLFGFANAGVALTGWAALLGPLPVGIAVGLALGKPLGIIGAILLAEGLGLGRRPAGATGWQVGAMALLCGIGFTMSLFIGALAFPAAPELVDQAKLGVLGGSLASALAGFALLRLAPSRS